METNTTTEYRDRPEVRTEFSPFRWIAITITVSLTLLLSLSLDASAETPAKRLSTAVPVETKQRPQFIVVYRDGVSLASRLRAEADLGVKPLEVFRNAFQGFVARLDRRDLRRLEADPRIRILEPDYEVSASGSAGQDRTVDSWGLDRIDQRSGPLDGRLSAGENGYGVEAYIIDTGIRPDHSEFAGRINPAGFSSINGGWGDCDGHGTHVAGTVAGSSYGVAPAATLTAVRVLDCEGSGTISGVIDGVDWMIADHRAGEPAVGNMSLGGSRSDALNLAIRRAVEDGVTMVVAAGNETTDACTKSPASAPEAVTVGSLKASDAPSGFSNFGPCVDLFAPGSDIKSAWHTSRTATNTISGTSMAAPHVAGAAALLLSRSPGLGPAEVSSRLVETSTPGEQMLDPGCLIKRMLYIGGGPNIADPETPPPPSNDAFADREPLGPLGNRTISSTCATAEIGEPGHGVPPFDYRPRTSIWFEWTAPASGLLVLDHRQSSFYGVMAVYTGESPEKLILEARNDPDDWQYGDDRVFVRVDAGTNYKIALDGYKGTSGTVNLVSTFTPGSGSSPGDPVFGPDNDNVAQAASLGSILEWDVRGSTVGATAQSGEPEHATWYGGGPFGSIWYRWTAPVNGVLTLRSSNYHDVAVYTGDSVATLERASSPEWGWGMSDDANLMPVRRGETYLIALETWPVLEDWTRLVGTLDPAPVNDDLANATRIESWDGPIRGTNLGATVESGEPSHDSSSQDGPFASVWYQWTAPGNGHLNLDASESSFDHPAVSVYTGDTMRNLERLAGETGEVSFAVRKGVNYKIAIDTWWPDEVGATSLRGDFITAPANDDVADAAPIDLNYSVVTGSTFGSTLETSEASPSSDSSLFPVGSVWYHWTPRHNMKITLSSDDADFETVTAYTGGSLESLNRVAGGDYSWLDLNVSAGTRYLFAVQDDPSEKVTFNLRLRRRIEPPRIVSAPKVVTFSRRAKFRFRGEPGVTFECRLDRMRSWKKCGKTVKYKRLRPGDHSFRVRARDGKSVSGATDWFWWIEKRGGR